MKPPPAQDAVIEPLPPSFTLQPVERPAAVDVALEISVALAAYGTVKPAARRWRAVGSSRLWSPL